MVRAGAHLSGCWWRTRSTAAACRLEMSAAPEEQGRGRGRGAQRGVAWIGAQERDKSQRDRSLPPPATVVLPTASCLPFTHLVALRVEQSRDSSQLLGQERGRASDTRQTVLRSSLVQHLHGTRPRAAWRHHAYMPQTYLTTLCGRLIGHTHTLSRHTVKPTIHTSAPPLHDTNAAPWHAASACTVAPRPRPAHPIDWAPHRWRWQLP